MKHVFALISKKKHLNASTGKPVNPHRVYQFSTRSDLKFHILAKFELQVSQLCRNCLFLLLLTLRMSQKPDHYRTWNNS